MHVFSKFSPWVNEQLEYLEQIVDQEQRDPQTQGRKPQENQGPQSTRRLPRRNLILRCT